LSKLKTKFRNCNRKSTRKHGLHGANRKHSVHSLLQVQKTETIKTKREDDHGVEVRNRKQRVHTIKIEYAIQKLKNKSTQDKNTVLHAVHSLFSGKALVHSLQ
jgi:hypothetical protein